MERSSEVRSERVRVLNRNIWAPFAQVPLLGWLFGALIAVALERLVGTPLALALGLPKIPVLFGFVIMLKKPILIPSATLYVLFIYVLPIGITTRLSISLTNRLAAELFRSPIVISVAIHLALLYATLHLWAGISDYRVLMLRLTLIAIMVTLSLNVINGYMGEFSCSHPGFMALGAYVASVFTMVLFVNDRLFGAAFLPPALGPFMFPIALILGGALGNVYDRVVHGYVVDFLHFYWQDYHFPAFNLADTAITLGAGMMILDMFRKPSDPSERSSDSQ